MAITAAMKTSVTQLYAALFNRAPDSDGLGYWVQQMDGGQTLSQVAKAMYDTTPARTYYPLWYSNDEIAGQFYTNLLGRTADTDGLAYWSGQLATKSLGDVLTDFLTAVVSYTSDPTAAGYDAALDALAIDSQSLFTNKVAVGEYFSQTLRSNDLTLAASVLSTVTKDAASVTTANAAAASSVAAASAQTFTLTTGADTTLTGGAGNDSFVSVVGTGGTAANGTTLNAGDNISGGSGTDTLSVAISGTNAAGVTTASVTMGTIENISISNFQTADDGGGAADQNSFGNTLDLAQTSGVTGITVTGSSATGDTALISVAAIATATMGNGSGDLSITYANGAVTGTTDAQTLTLTGQTAGTFTVAAATGGVETLNIASGTAANTLAISDSVTATMTTINVTGAQNLTLTEATTNPDDAVTRINAGEFTGKLTVTTGSAGQDVSITGGTANDAITFSADTFTSADSVDGGSGTDSLSIATTITTATTLANVTNVETLKITGANSVTLAANISATTIDVSPGTDITSTVTLNSGYTNATTVLMDSSDVVVNSSANAELTAKFTAAAVVTVTGGTGTDTLNITADNGTVTFASKITVVDAITIVDGGDDAASGDNPAGKDVILNVLAYGTALTIDGSALDAGATSALNENLTVDATGATKNLIITGGGGKDSITGGTMNDSISAGDGNDTVTMAGNLTLADTLDGGSGTDTLAVSSLTSTGLTNVSNFETLALSGLDSSATLAANLSFTDISMTVDTDIAQVLTLSTGYTSATTVSMDTKDKVVNSANVALTVSANATDLEAADLTTITGGTGTDTLNITADGATTVSGIVAFASLITNVDTITIVDKGDASDTAGFDVDLNLGAYGKALTINATAMDAADATFAGAFATAEKLVVTGTGATKELTIMVGAGGSTISTGTGAYNDVVTGGAGVDAITSGDGNDNYSLGAGADTINMGAYFDNNDTIAGGDGTDVLSVNQGSTDVQYINVSSIATLAILTTGATTLSTYANAAGITTITGLATAANTITATGMTSNLTINAATTAAITTDSLTGGSGNDTFKFVGTDTFAAGEAVKGGSGTDTLALTLGTTSNAAVITDTNLVTGIESITFTTGDTANVGIGKFTISEGAFVAVTGGVVNASGITGTGTAWIDASADTDSSFVMTGVGGTGTSQLIGGAGADTITGGTGADTITGGLGADVMAGGTGANVFRYVGAGFETGTISPATVYYGGTVVAGSSVVTSSMDKITDFKAGDTINTNVAGANNANMATNGTGATWTALAGYLKGTYDSTAATFTFSTTGSDTLFAYDYDGSTSTSDLRGIVLVGYVDSGTTDTTASGLFGEA